jgi:hypothetical protein
MPEEARHEEVGPYEFVVLVILVSFSSIGILLTEAGAGGNVTPRRSPSLAGRDRPAAADVEDFRPRFLSSVALSR